MNKKLFEQCPLPWYTKSICANAGYHGIFDATGANITFNSRDVALAFLDIINNMSRKDKIKNGWVKPTVPKKPKLPKVAKLYVVKNHSRGYANKYTYTDDINKARIWKSLYQAKKHAYKDEEVIEVKLEAMTNGS